MSLSGWLDKGWLVRHRPDRREIKELLGIAHRDNFRNMLIWGDNKLAMASLLEQFRGEIDHHNNEE